MISLLLIDDHASFRQPLAFLFAREPDIIIAGQAGSLAEARSLLHLPDIAIVDLDLPDGSGIDLIRELQIAKPDAVALVLTASGSRNDIARAIEAGAAGVLQKTVSIADLVNAVRRLHAGEQLESPHETIALLRFASQQRERSRGAQEALAGLSAREREVLQSLAQGRNDRGIAQHLSISPDTVRSHLTNILAKLRVESRLEAVVFAIRHGGVHLE